jgi:hypothetical protein
MDPEMVTAGQLYSYQERLIFCMVPLEHADAKQLARCPGSFSFTPGQNYCLFAYQYPDHQRSAIGSTDAYQGYKRKRGFVGMPKFRKRSGRKQ